MIGLPGLVRPAGLAINRLPNGAEAGPGLDCHGPGRLALRRGGLHARGLEADVIRPRVAVL